MSITDELHLVKQITEINESLKTIARSLERNRSEDISREVKREVKNQLNLLGNNLEKQFPKL
jgi:IS30 family transposase